MAAAVRAGSVTDRAVAVDVQRAEIDQLVKAILRRQGRPEPFNPILDVFRRHTRERSQVNADHLDVVPFLKIADDAIPATLF